MADLSDVETALVTLIQAATYPSGTTQPSIVGVQVAIGRGWPLADDIDGDLGAGKCIVSVYSQPNVERNVTRYPREQQTLTVPVHTLTATVVGNVVTIGGAVSTPQNVVVICGLAYAFSYQVQPGDTLNSIAAALAALIAASFPGTGASGAVITIAGKPGAVQARIGGTGQVWTEQRRQQRGFQIICWCPTPALRDALAAAIDLALSQIDWLTLADQSAARIRYERSYVSDEGEKVQIYRRDLCYTVEYPTATVITATETVTIGATVTPSPADTTQPAYV